MSKRTYKAGITGKYGTRYGSSIRKQMKKIEQNQHSKYICTFCKKNNVRRKNTGIWSCKSCKRVMTGGAWVLHTSTAIVVKSTIRRLRNLNNL